MSDKQNFETDPPLSLATMEQMFLEIQKRHKACMLIYDDEQLCAPVFLNGQGKPHVMLGMANMCVIVVEAFVRSGFRPVADLPGGGMGT